MGSSTFVRMDVWLKTYFR